MAEQRKYQLPLPGGPSRIGAPGPGDRNMPVSKFEDQQPDIIAKILELVGDPMENIGVGQAMVGGLPDGLNSEALKMLLKRSSQEVRPLISKPTSIRSTLDEGMGAFKDSQVDKYLKRFFGGL